VPFSPIPMHGPRAGLVAFVLAFALLAPSRAHAQTDSAARAVDRPGVPRSAVGHAPASDVPDLDPAAFCPGGAEWILRANGTVVRTSSNVTFDARMAPVFGIRRHMAPSWTIIGSAFPGGKLCVDGNVAIVGVTGTAAAPRAMTIIATGSVQIIGSPHVRPASADSVLIVAGGDVHIGGTSRDGANNFEGLIYAENQCIVSGQPRVAGPLLCANLEPSVVTSPMTPVAGFAPFMPQDYGRVSVIPGVKPADRCDAEPAKQRSYSCVQRVP
jgi:hypothetical protein